MTNRTALPRLVACLLMVLSCGQAPAVEPTPPRGNLSQPRTGQTQKFGSGTITHRSDGSSSRTEKFGSGTLQRDQPGRPSR